MSKRYGRYYGKKYYWGFRGERCGYPFKVSRAFRVARDEDNRTTMILGSANDIMKVIRDLKYVGYVPYVTFKERGAQVYHEYVLRANRKYIIEFDDEYKYYRVWRFR